MADSVQALKGRHYSLIDRLLGYLRLFSLHLFSFYPGDVIIDIR